MNAGITAAGCHPLTGLPCTIMRENGRFKKRWNCWKRTAWSAQRKGGAPSCCINRPTRASISRSIRSFGSVRRFSAYIKRWSCSCRIFWPCAPGRPGSMNWSILSPSSNGESAPRYWDAEHFRILSSYLSDNSNTFTWEFGLNRLYRKISRDLIEKMTLGVYTVGSWLPAEHLVIPDWKRSCQSLIPLQVCCISMHLRFRCRNTALEI